MTDDEISTAVLEGRPYVDLYLGGSSEWAQDGSSILERSTERIWREVYFVLSVRDPEGQVLAYSHSAEPDEYAEREFREDFLVPSRYGRDAVQEYD